jgi:hypothetical protein
VRVLVACEESQRVCIEFRRLGHEAYSCDIHECSGGHPEWHIHGDALKALEAGDFRTADGTQRHVDKWDLLIAHPPCTYLTVSGNRWFSVEKYGDKAIERMEKRKNAADFFMKFANADIEKIAIENPVGAMSRLYRKPDQIIQPYWFGDAVRKGTCLWLKGLPNLLPTGMVKPDLQFSSGKAYSGAAFVVRDDKTGKILRYGDPEVAKQRSKTFHGIARAMAEQWGGDA